MEREILRYVWLEQMPLSTSYLCGRPVLPAESLLAAPLLTSSLEVGVNPFRCERFINVMDRGESRTFTRMNVPLSYIRPHERTPLFKF